MDKRFIDAKYKELFKKVSEIGNKPGVANFGQGAPNMDIPDMLMPALNEVALNNANHQYSAEGGPRGLLEQVARHYGNQMGREINAKSEVIVCEGASDAFYGFLEVYIQPADEIVTFVPCFGFYLMMMRQFKNINLKCINLFDKPNFEIDWEKFETCFSENTRCLYLNTPNNPTGKVFSRDEMERMAKLIQDKYPKVIVFADNVYCDMVFGDAKHVEIASLPGMWNRTVTSYSFGKTFGATGWRLGFTLGPSEMINSLKILQGLSNFCGVSLILAAAELVLQRAEQEYKGEKTYYQWVCKLYQDRYKKVSEVISNCCLPLEIVPAQGGFFLLAKIDKAVVGMPVRHFYEDLETNDHGGKKLESAEDWMNLEGVDYSLDYAFCNYVAFEYKTVFFPISAFMPSNIDPPKTRQLVNYIRISICKDDKSIDLLNHNLAKLKSA